MVSFEQEGLPFVFCQGIGEAITKIQSGPMPALAKITISGSRDARMFHSDRFNADLRIPQEVIDLPAENRVASTVDHDRSLNKIHS